MNLQTATKFGLKWTTLSSIVLAVIAIFKIAILTRFLEKSDFGLIAIVLLILNFLNLFMDMGLTTAILHKDNISKKVYASIFWLNLFFSVFLYIILVLITPYITRFYNEPELNKLIPLMGMSLIISAFGKQFRTIKQKELKFKTLAIVDILTTLISFLFAIYLASNDYKVYTLIYSALLQFVIQNLIFFTIGVSQYGILFHFKIKETIPFLKIGIYQVGSQVVNYFNRDLDVLIISKLFGKELLGGYSLAKQLIFKPSQVINPILTKVASPVLAKFQHDLEKLRQNYLKLVNIVWVINLPIYILFILFAPLIVRVFYGADFENIIPLVRILSIYMLIRSIGNPVGSLVIATGKTHLEFYWNLSTLVIMPLAIYIGSFYNLIGVTIAITITMLILYYPNWKYLIYPLIKVSFWEFFKTLSLSKSFKNIKEYI